MTHEEAFLRDILEHPDDDGRRLIFADWLEDNGDPDRAEFIRVQIAREHDRARAGKGYLDLRRVNALVLEDVGVPASSIARVGSCMYCGGGPFASFRREGAAAGRQLSWIALPAA